MAIEAKSVQLSRFYRPEGALQDLRAVRIETDDGEMEIILPAIAWLEESYDPAQVKLTDVEWQ